MGERGDGVWERELKRSTGCCCAEPLKTATIRVAFHVRAVLGLATLEICKLGYLLCLLVSLVWCIMDYLRAVLRNYAVVVDVAEFSGA
ncbi:hypothetical protein DM860_000060 [Cuscuta australis]|uniref:Uncharacterized protein n=1 Tax=Cuscuta australis TaxID=267555 RepID=A0A328CWE2_9ASTE|nr:hypothetical protein DM860_000060 [Cuscuta australis]